LSLLCPGLSGSVFSSSVASPFDSSTRALEQHPTRGSASSSSSHFPFFAGDFDLDFDLALDLVRHFLFLAFFLEAERPHLFFLDEPLDFERVFFDFLEQRDFLFFDGNRLRLFGLHFFEPLDFEDDGRRRRFVAFRLVEPHRDFLEAFLDFLQLLDLAFLEASSAFLEEESSGVLVGSGFLEATLVSLDFLVADSSELLGSAFLEASLDFLEEEGLQELFLGLDFLAARRLRPEQDAFLALLAELFLQELLRLDFADLLERLRQEDFLAEVFLREALRHAFFEAFRV